MTAWLAANPRPDDWNFPLLLHVLGAMLLVGGLLTAVLFQYAGWSRGPAHAIANARITFRTLLIVALPAWFLMRIAAWWIADKEGFTGDDDPAWIEIGYVTAELGGLLLLIAIILSGLGLRRARKTDGASLGLSRAATIIATLLVIAYVVAVWAMSGKPT